MNGTFGKKKEEEEEEEVRRLELQSYQNDVHAMVP